MFTSLVFNVFLNSKWEDIYISSVGLHWEVASYCFKAYYSILGIHGMELGEVVPWFLFLSSNHLQKQANKRCRDKNKQT